MRYNMRMQSLTQADFLKLFHAGVIQRLELHFTHPPVKLVLRGVDDLGNPYQVISQRSRRVKQFSADAVISTLRHAGVAPASVAVVF